MKAGIALELISTFCSILELLALCCCCCCCCCLSPLSNRKKDGDDDGKVSVLDGDVAATTASDLRRWWWNTTQEALWPLKVSGFSKVRPHLHWNGIFILLVEGKKKTKRTRRKIFLFGLRCHSCFSCLVTKKNLFIIIISSIVAVGQDAREKKNEGDKSAPRPR